MFFKRRSSRANSYVENDGNPRSQSFDDFSEKRPDSSRKDQTIQGHDQDDSEMYPRQQQPSQEQNFPVRGMSNSGHGGMPGMGAPVPAMSTVKPEPMPDLLAAAFNQAVRPYTEKIEQLESQLADMQSWVEQLEAQRAEVHSWIDKRGLRPDVPSSIAKIMDTTTPDAAHTLNAQLDRKITIVNFDLHRLQDDLNDSISSSHFASSMLKFLPDIQRLTLLPQGPKYAFDLILKLGGNLNSHGGLDSADSADIAARRDFYSRLDTAMVDVVQRRFGEGEEWNVQREIKRIEKTASYLKTYGVEPYFPQTREVMAREMEFQPNGAPNGQGTPPRANQKECERLLPGHSDGAVCENSLSESLESFSRDGRIAGPVKRELAVMPILSILAFGRGRTIDFDKDMPGTLPERKRQSNIALACRSKEKLPGPAEAYNFPIFDGMCTWSNSKVMIQQEPQEAEELQLNTTEQKRMIPELEVKRDAKNFSSIDTSDRRQTRTTMSFRRNFPKPPRAKGIKRADWKFNSQQSWLKRQRKHLHSGSRIVKSFIGSLSKSPTIKPHLSSAIKQLSQKQRVDSMQRTHSWVKAERWRHAPAADKVDDAQPYTAVHPVARRRFSKFVQASFSWSSPGSRSLPDSGNSDEKLALVLEQTAAEAEDIFPGRPGIEPGTDANVNEGLTPNASSHTSPHIAPVTFTDSDGKAVTSLFGPFISNGVMPPTVLNNESQYALRAGGNGISPSI